MKVVCALVVLVVAAEGVSVYQLVKQEWKLFMEEHNKTYGNDMEEDYRLGVYLYNRKRIAEHNTRYEKGEVTYAMGMNQFGDLYEHEFLALMRTMIRPELYSRQNQSYYLEPANVVLADTVDWRTKGAVTPVKNQGSCGSCWAFSTTGALEGQHFRQTGKLVSLSEQNLVDCSKENDGWQFMLMAYNYIIQNKGIDTEEAYPYEGREGPCRFKADKVGATMTAYILLPEGNEDRLKSAVATKGPISVAIEVSANFQFYTHGVFYDPTCSDRLNHGVLVVGYGTESGQDYWLVKNSWSTSWGDHGYIKMARNKRNNCGIAMVGNYPFI